MSEIAELGPGVEERGVGKIGVVCPYVTTSFFGEPSAWGIHVEGNQVVPFVELPIPKPAILINGIVVISSQLPDNGPKDKITRTKHEHTSALLKKLGIIHTQAEPNEQLKLFSSTTIIV
jgi:hypothetical protein